MSFGRHSTHSRSKSWHTSSPDLPSLTTADRAPHPTSPVSTTFSRHPSRRASLLCSRAPESITCEKCAKRGSVSDCHPNALWCCLVGMCHVGTEWLSSRSTPTPTKSMATRITRWHCPWIISRYCEGNRNQERWGVFLACPLGQNCFWKYSSPGKSENT